MEEEEDEEEEEEEAVKHQENTGEDADGGSPTHAAPPAGAGSPAGHAEDQQSAPSPHGEGEKGSRNGCAVEAAGLGVMWE